jgi:hypothetical protein
LIDGAVIDTVNAKLLATTYSLTSPRRRGVLRRNLDGTECNHTDILKTSAAKGFAGGELVIDILNAKLVSASHQGLLRCNLDGTGCAYRENSAATRPMSSPRGVTKRTFVAGGTSAVIDTINGKLLIATTTYEYPTSREDYIEEHIAGVPEMPLHELLHEVALFRCNLDGTGCTHSVISQDYTDNPLALIDATHAELLVVTVMDPYPRRGPSELGLFRCSLDGTACKHADITLGQRLNQPGKGAVSMALDTVHAKLLVVATTYPRKLELFSVCLD